MGGRRIKERERVIRKGGIEGGGRKRNKYGIERKRKKERKKMMNLIERQNIKETRREVKEGGN